MKKILIILFLSASLPSLAQMVPQWKNIFGWPLYYGAYPTQMVNDTEGNSYVLETVVNYNTSETSCHDPLLRKIDASGNTVWFKNLGKFPCHGEYAYKLKLHNNNLYTIYSRSDSLYNDPATLYISKYTVAGDSVWSKKLGVENPNSYSTEYQIDFDSIGNIYASGWQSGGIIYRLNDTGNITDSIIVTINNLRSTVYNFFITSDNKLAILSTVIENNIGKWFLTLRNFSGINLWSTQISGYLSCPQLLEGEDNSIYEWHQRYETQIGYFLTVNKYSFSGSNIWSKDVLAQLDGTYNYRYNVFPSLTTTEDNNIIIGYSAALNLFSTNSAAMIRKLSSQTGDSLWSFNLSRREYCSA